MAHVGWSTKLKLLTLTCKARRLVLARQQAKNLSRVEKFLQGYNKNQGVPTPGHLPPTTRMETLAKVFRVNLPASVEKRLFRPPIAPYRPSPNFLPCPTATIGCRAAAPTRSVRPGRSSRQVRRESWSLRGRLRGFLDGGKVLLS